MAAVAFALIRVAIIGFGASLLRVGGVGLDPYTAANIGTGERLGLSLGVYQLMINLVLLILIFFFWSSAYWDRHSDQYGLDGLFIDFIRKSLNFSQFLRKVGCKRALLVIGILFFTFGASFYMSAKVGSAPYDAIAPTIVDRTKANYRVVRVIQDVAFATLGWITGGPIGIGTFISAFLVGPLIKFWDDYASVPFIEKTIKKSLFK